MRRFDLIDEFTSVYVPIQHRKVAEMPNDETSVSERRNIRTDGLRRRLLFVGLSALFWRPRGERSSTGDPRALGAALDLDGPGAGIERFSELPEPCISGGFFSVGNPAWKQQILGKATPGLINPTNP